MFHQSAKSVEHHYSLIIDYCIVLRSGVTITSLSYYDQVNIPKQIVSELYVTIIFGRRPPLQRGASVRNGYRLTYYVIIVTLLTLKILRFFA